MEQSRRLGAAFAATVLVAGVAVAAPFIVNLQAYSNASGTHRTYSTRGDLDQANPFFQSLGTNGRRCSTCHMPSQAFGLGAAMVRQIFASTSGLHPLFREVDGANSPEFDTSTLSARQQAYSLLLSRGVFRVGLGIPANAEFTLEAVDDPYGYASARELSLFRRPLPATNLKFLAAVMWDGRETFAGRTIAFDLASQATHATLDHAETAASPSTETLEQIVGLESSLFTAQSYDRSAWTLTDAGGQGGPVILSAQPFVRGINSPLSSSFDPRVFRLYDAWQTATGTPGPARQAIARGQSLFNGRRFVFGGLSMTCSRCHNVPNVGSDSNGQFFNTGTASGSRRPADLPLYTLRNVATGARLQTSDPGRALITGRWLDVGRFKVPALRGLAARAPYFHNGLAATVDDVVAFYDARMSIGLTAEERADLAAFLRAL